MASSSALLLAAAQTRMYKCAGSKVQRQKPPGGQEFKEGALELSCQRQQHAAVFLLGTDVEEGFFSQRNWAFFPSVVLFHTRLLHLNI